MTHPKMSLLSLAALGVLCLAGAGSAKDSNSTVVDERWCGVEQTTCGLHDDDGPWMAMLQQWALETQGSNERHGRIMALPPAQGYYVSDRMDGTLLPPPPPPHNKHPNHPQHQPPLPAGARPYDEWQHAPPLHSGKIVNRPPNPYKDKFKPSYPAPVQNQPIPVHSSGLDRVDENRQPPQKQVSETDLYLLGAIEKLVWRADIMEKRLRKIEETIHYMVAGNEAKPEPCGENYTRVGGGCYHISSDNANWKGASYACRKLKGHMLELDSDAERDSLANNLFGDNKGSKVEFWTGGLNPGLLWIWSHSARPVLSNATTSFNITGDGRCLAWRRDAGAARAALRGADCALRQRYVCEKTEDKEKLSNEIERVARMLRAPGGRKPKILWTDEP
ncbi:hypothetical protein B5X24_HaOG204508 [Helicoverpa armigera]|uniref:C-type lectin domain-containing protein n=1 Tax=Helicoverpa armigera TaxID=29058 RepID=A0A2W1BNF7_HELAM|nr:hypothetical protein B5X24_HaOG204508 [Helicoverpa armigera]